MKIVKRDPQLKEQQLKEKEQRIAQEKVRDEYLEGLRKNRKFQEIVIDGIIRKSLDELTDIRNIKNADLNNLQEAGMLIIQAKAARMKLESILSKLI